MYVEYRGGVIASLGGVKLLFDHAPPVRGGIRLVSHAHSDHAPPRVVEDTIMTPETHELVSCLRSVVKNLMLRRINEDVKFDDVRVRLVNAGHVLGSSQFLVETNVGAMLYTGDINTYETLVSKPAEPVNAEILILESTYGSPFFSFPDRELVYAEILRWILRCIRNNEIPALKVYSIGKSQEIIKLINTATSLPVLTGPVVSKTSGAYSRCGVKLSFTPLNSVEGMEIAKSGEFVYVDSSRRELLTSRRVRWALATGWALRYRFRGYDAAFPLSSHADFKGLLEYVENVNPAKTYTIHGYTNTLARELTKLGKEAEPLDEITINKQTKLIFE